MKKLFAFLLAPFLLWASPEPEPVVVGTASGYAPFVSLNEKGQYEGFDIDLAELVAQKLNRKLVLKDLGSMPSLMLALKQNKVDMLIWAISITQDRQKNMEMVYYQGDQTTEIPFLFWKEIPAGIQSIADLPKKGISVEAGTLQEGVLKKFPMLQLKTLDKVTDAVMELKFGKSVATTVDPSLIARFQSQNPEIKVLNLPLPPEEQSLGNGICISKNNAKLATQVRQAIEELTAEGKIAELETKWKLR